MPAIHLADSPCSSYHEDGVPGVTQPVIRPDSSVLYDFPLKPAGTHWMHSHQGLQEALLLSVPLIVHDPSDRARDAMESHPTWPAVRLPFASPPHLKALENLTRGHFARRQFLLIQQISSAIHEDRSTLVCQEDEKMPQVTVYKPNGETLLSTNAKKFEQTKGGIILHLEGEHAKVYGTTMITTLPYVILCGQGC